MAGLIEGDGHIYVPSSLRDAKKGQLTAHIEISFSIQDLLLAQKIKD